jgi:hypothetical protein
MSLGGANTLAAQRSKIAKEAAWLAANPDFEERPASIREFIGPDYLNIEKGVRPAVLDVLVDIFGEEPNSQKLSKYRQAIATGGIGWGKSTVASIALTYMVHWLLCLRDPQDFFDLLPGSRIALMMMSTSEPQARQVIFSDIKARIENSPWFRSHPYDPKFRNQIRWSDKDIWIIPGDSSETTFEGYNILSGIIDEIDSHKVTKQKDYAEQGYTTIYSRMTSRFGDRGFVFCVGQTKYDGSFASRHYEEFKKDPDSYAVKLALWESLGWEKFAMPDGTRNSFFYDIKRKKILSREAGEMMGGTGEGEHLIEVPNAYRRDFENDPSKALRDLAGIPPTSKSPFILFDYKIEDARELWAEKAMEFYGTDQEPVDVNGLLEQWFKSPNAVPRVAHIDIGISKDALGFAMGHSPGLVEVEGEAKPFIFIDMAWRMVAPPGGQIELAHVRQLLYTLRDSLGFRFKRITLDSYQSTDMMQQLNKRRFKTDIVSMDKSVIPYYDLREALNENRLALPMLMAHLRPDDPPVDILRRELVQLQDLGVKIDHPPDGSKDVADAIAGVCTELMGNANKRVLGSTSQATPVIVGQVVSPSPQSFHPAVRADRRASPPVPWRPAVRRGVR